MSKCLSVGCDQLKGANLDGTFRKQRTDYCGRCYHIKTRYGVSFEFVQVLRESQKNRCAICKSPLKGFNAQYGDAIDHCHKTGNVRGLLCQFCNRGLGCFRDSPTKLLYAIKYLTGV